MERDTNMKPYKSIYQEREILHEMSFIRGADLFLGGVKDFDKEGLSSLDKRNKDKFLRFCKSMKLFYKSSYSEMLKKEKEKKLSDWDELDDQEKKRIERLVQLLDENPEFNQY